MWVPPRKILFSIYTRVTKIENSFEMFSSYKNWVIRSLLTTNGHPSLFSHYPTPTLRIRRRLEVHEHGSTMDSPKRKARRVLYGSLLRMLRKKDREVPVIRIFCCLGSSGGRRICRGRGDRRRSRRSPRWRSWCRFSGFADCWHPGLDDFLAKLMQIHWHPGFDSFWWFCMILWYLWM